MSVLLRAKGFRYVLQTSCRAADNTRELAELYRRAWTNVNAPTRYLGSQPRPLSLTSVLGSNIVPDVCSDVRDNIISQCLAYDIRRPAQCGRIVSSLPPVCLVCQWRLTNRARHTTLCRLYIF
eukprot:14005181-Heterocapsa_arctica.AAC.1